MVTTCLSLFFIQISRMLKILSRRHRLEELIKGLFMSYLEQIKCCVDNTIYKLSININLSGAPDPDVKESRSESQLKSFSQWGNLLYRSSEDSLSKTNTAHKDVHCDTFHQAWGMLTAQLLSMNLPVGQFAQSDRLSLSEEKHMTWDPPAFFV